MAFPSIRDSITTDSPSSSTTVLIDLPATIESGDLLIALLVIDGSRTIDTAGGWDQTTAGTWTNKATTGTGIGTHATHIWMKVADGTEDSAQLSMTISGAESGCSRVLCIQDWVGSLSLVTVSTVAEANSAAPDPNIGTAVSGSGDNLFIAWYGFDRPGARTNTGYPTNYADNQATNTGGSDFSGTGEAIATRELTAASDNPSAFTLSDIAQWDAYTIVVEPAASGGTTDVNYSGLNRGIMRGVARKIG